MPLAATANDRLTVFAAASLKGALDDVLSRSGTNAVVSYGGSGLIARQVAQGAPADLVILAHPDWMEWLVSNSRDKYQIQSNFLGNSLVVIGPKGTGLLSEMNLSTLNAHMQDGDRLAIGMTRSVPAGVYGRQWLEQAGLWAEVQNRLAETDNVRAALALVARGEAPLGVVYASDAAAETQVAVLYNVPSHLHVAITYPMAIVENKNTSQAMELAEFLHSQEAADVFISHGFTHRGEAP